MGPDGKFPGTLFDPALLRMSRYSRHPNGLSNCVARLEARPSWLQDASFHFS